MKKSDSPTIRKQFSTFYVSDRLYGIDVVQVQEVAKPLPITEIHLAPNHVMGLINLRGQIATAIGLRELFEMPRDSDQKMSIVSRHGGVFLSLLVDRIGDVIEVSETDFETTPEIVPETIRRFMGGVYKLVPGEILSVIDMNKLTHFLAK